MSKRVGFETNRELARTAGRIGGKRCPAHLRTFARVPGAAAAAARIGAQKRRERALRGVDYVK